MHIFDRGNILLLPEPLHTALQQAIVWWVERVRTEEAGQRTAGSKVQVSSHHTLDTRESGHWDNTSNANTCKHWQVHFYLEHLYLYQLGPIIARLHLWPPELLLKPTANTWQAGTLEMGLGWEHRIVFCIGQRFRDLSSVASNSVHNV